MLTKVCRGCGKELPIDQFYKHSQMVDGYLNYCKDCVKNRIKKHRKENQEYFREYDFYRNRTEKRREWKKKYIKDNEVGKKYRESKRIYLQNRRHTIDGYDKCHNALDRAVLRKQIIRPNNCQVCGKKSKVMGHHCDYSKPLNVVWMCSTCHGLYHGSNSDMGEKVREKVDLLFKQSIKQSSYFYYGERR